MSELANRATTYYPALSGDAQAISHMKQAITSGKHWYSALLEAIGLWVSAKEDYNGRTYHYLLAGEAFDWLLLAERLCQVVEELLPDDEKTALIIHGKPPLNITNEQFKELIGREKYRQYLNYFYGVTVEKALVMAVQEEVRKEQWIWGFNGEYNTLDEVYRRIYGHDKAAMLRQFRSEKGYRQRRSITLTELNEFTYWSFKYRFRNCDKAKIASDTRKGLERLKLGGLCGYLFPDLPPAD